MGQLHKVHDLNKLHDAFLQHYRSAKNVLGKDAVLDQNYLSHLKTLIERISLLDSNSQGFRYAEDTNKIKIIAPEETYNLKSVFDLLEDVSNFLAHIEDEFGLHHEI
jgi:hypothetical protein